MLEGRGHTSNARRADTSETSPLLGWEVGAGDKQQVVTADRSGVEVDTRARGRLVIWCQGNGLIRITRVAGPTCPRSVGRLRVARVLFGFGVWIRVWWWDPKILVGMDADASGKQLSKVPEGGEARPGRGGVDKTFRPYLPDQMWLMPPSIDEWLAEDHLARFVSELVEDVFDLDVFYAVYTEKRGFPPMTLG